jgi:hypothetical protein
MLRDETNGSPALHAVLDQFELEDETLLDVLLFRTLNSHSFLWQLRLTDSIYYVYATDFVESLEQITSTLQVATDGTPGELVPVKRPMIFEEASPVTSSSLYDKPDDFDTKIAHYTTESGYDFVFLYRTEQSSEEYAYEF